MFRRVTDTFSGEDEKRLTLLSRLPRVAEIIGY